MDAPSILAGDLLWQKWKIFTATKGFSIILIRTTLGSAPLASASIYAYGFKDILGKKIYFGAQDTFGAKFVSGPGLFFFGSKVLKSKTHWVRLDPFFKIWRMPLYLPLSVDRSVCPSVEKDVQVKTS